MHVSIANRFVFRRGVVKIRQTLLALLCEATGQGEKAKADRTAQVACGAWCVGMFIDRRSAFTPVVALCGHMGLEPVPMECSVVDNVGALGDVYDMT